MLKYCVKLCEWAKYYMEGVLITDSHQRLAPRPKIGFNLVANLAYFSFLFEVRNMANQWGMLMNIILLKPCGMVLCLPTWKGKLQFFSKEKE